MVILQSVYALKEVHNSANIVRAVTAEMKGERRVVFAIHLAQATLE
jgi:hypothetical protein